MSSPENKHLRRWETLIARIPSNIAAILLIAMLGLMVVEIISRAVFGKSTLVADEYTGYMLVAMSVLALSGALRDGTHVRLSILMDTLIRRFGNRIGTVLQVFSLLMLALLAAFLAWISGNMAFTSFTQGTLAVTVTRTPLWIPQVFMFLGFVLLFLQAITMLWTQHTPKIETPEDMVAGSNE